VLSAKSFPAVDAEVFVFGRALPSLPLPLGDGGEVAPVAPTLPTVGRTAARRGTALQGDGGDGAGLAVANGPAWRLPLAFAPIGSPGVRRGGGGGGGGDPGEWEAPQYA
jgi:hypothetical protein